jgi:Tfp pilus assembly protein PilN
MKAVNLIPRERAGTQRQSKLGGFVREPLLPASIALVVLAAAAVGFAAHSASSTVASRNATVRDLDVRLSKLAAAQSSQQAHTATAGASRTTAATTLTSQRTSWDGFLWSLSRVLPEDVWVMNLSAGSTATGPTTPAPAPSTGAPVNNFLVTGYTYSQPSVARMMRRLALVPWLQDVNLVSSSKTALANHTVYQFTVGANFVNLPEAGT